MPVWRCISRLEYATKYCKESATILEENLHLAIMQAINATRASRHEMIPFLTAHMERTLREQAKDGIDAAQVETRIAELKATTMELVRESTASNSVGENMSKLKAMSDEIKTLCDMLAEYKESCNSDSDIKIRMNEITEILQSEPEDSTTYNDTLVRQLIQTIKVMGEDKLEITFKCGMKYEQSMIPKGGMNKAS